MANEFTESEWRAIQDLLDSEGEVFGLPARRSGSLVIGSFNIRKLGRKSAKSDGAWKTLKRICERFDLLAIQEIQDDLEGLKYLRDELLEDRYGLVASDITGSFPGARPAPERLGFLYRRDTVKRTEVASDITYDRSAVLDTLYEFRLSFWRSFDDYTEKHADWQVESALRKQQNKRPTRPPVIRLPKFLSFIRQPLCVSFSMPRDESSTRYEFLAVNAHLLYGRYKHERRLEFEALVAWLVARARQVEHLYHPNLVLLGDLNLDFRKVDKRRAEIEQLLKGLNEGELKSTSVEVNFPFLTPHPPRPEGEVSRPAVPANGIFRTNARLSETYDQIAFFIQAQNQMLPRVPANDSAGTGSPDGYDYGVFNFVDLFSRALGIKPVLEMAQSEARVFYRKFEHDFTDHMPIWVRLPAE